MTKLLAPKICERYVHLVQRCKWYGRSLYVGRYQDVVDFMEIILIYDERKPP